MLDYWKLQAFVSFFGSIQLTGSVVCHLAIQILKILIAIHVHYSVN